MKAQQGLIGNNNGQGESTSDRAFTDQNEKLREHGIGNSGGQRSDHIEQKDHASSREEKGTIVQKKPSNKSGGFFCTSTLPPFERYSC